MAGIQELLATPPSRNMKRLRESLERGGDIDSPVKSKKKQLVTPELSSPQKQPDTPEKSDGSNNDDEDNDIKVIESAADNGTEAKKGNGDDSESKNSKNSESINSKKQLDLLDKQKLRELAKKEKEQKKEEERIAREQKKEEEKLAREQKKEEERIAREQKKEEERIAREQEKIRKKQKLEEEKKRKEKLKEEEKLRKQVEKEEKEKIRLEKKKALEEEKLEKKKAEEEKKRLAEEEKKKAEEAKERSQMKISSFFQMKKSDVNPKPKLNPQAIDQFVSKTTDEKTGDQEVAYYDKLFLPFFKKANATIYELKISKTEATEINKNLEELLKLDQDSSYIVNSEPLTSIFSKYAKYKELPVEQISRTNPEEIVAALNSSSATEEKLCLMLKQLPPIKYIQFYENLRPPYIGTWSSKAHSISFPKLEPFNTALTGLDYDYDSDIDWNNEDGDEGEGEDIDGDEDDEDDEDMGTGDEEDDFVDFDDAQRKKKKLIGPLVSICIWNDGNDEEFFKKMSFVPLGTNTLPIEIQKEVEVQNIDETKSSNNDNSNNNIKPSNESSPSKTVKVNLLTPQKPKIEDEKVLEELRKFILENNDFSIVTLVELSHKQLKTFTKSMIKRTIQDISIYNKKSGKWEIKE